MGFFSWKKSDDGTAIRNKHVGGKKAIPCKMIDDAGNEWVELNYDGYGIFGGKDYYALLAEMNGCAGRDAGIKLDFSGDPVKRPKLVRVTCRKSWSELPDSEIDENQGYWADTLFGV